MAVKTPFADVDFNNILSQYDLGVCAQSEAIQQGPVQTNFFIDATQLENLLPPAALPAEKPPLAPPPKLVGSCRGLVHTNKGAVAPVLEIGDSGSAYATMGEQPRTLFRSVSCQDNLPQFLNAGGGRFLRWWMRGELEIADVNRGRPYKPWLESKLREGVLNGSLVAFSQRESPTGPLSHWMELRKRAAE